MMHLRSASTAAAIAIVLSIAGCGQAARSEFSNVGQGGTPPAFGSSGSSGSSATGSMPPASFGPAAPSSDGGTSLAVSACGSGVSTTVSGTVYDPAGKNPLYGVAVYVPKSKPDPLKLGATCDSCSGLYSGSPVAAAVTDAAGKFTMQNVPDGNGIPLVIQIGKWRKQMTIPNVAPCHDNPLPDKSLTLPKNQKEGDIPNIAISTGGADSLECLLLRVGVDPAEYTPGAAGPGRIHIFQGAAKTGKAPNTSPAAPSSPVALWTSAQELMQYDITLLSCEGEETVGRNQQALYDYTAAGGRAFASHFHYAWFNTGPFGSQNLATWYPGVNAWGHLDGQVLTTLPNGQPFPKGIAMNQWLANVGALTGGLLPIKQAKHNADVTAANAASVPWIVPSPPDTMYPNMAQYFSFDTPFNVPGDKVCGRAVFSDIHVGAAGNDYPGSSSITPMGCDPGDLSPQEKALEFMLFDLSACITPVGLPPKAPPTGPAL